MVANGCHHVPVPRSRLGPDVARTASSHGRTEIEIARRQVTLREVAAASGVAVSTASRALTRPGRVSHETAQRVLTAAEDLGYVPSATGRALRSGRTGTVALVVPDTGNPYFYGIVRGTQVRLRAAGYAHVLVDTEESADAEETELARLRGITDGVVLAASRLPDERLMAWSEEIALVAINRAVPEPSVVVDTPGGAVSALAHLVELGHLRVAYAAGPATSWSDARRRAALRLAARHMGVEVVELGPFLPRISAGAAAARAVLEADVTGVLAFNDLLAFGMLSHLAGAGVAVPAQLSVIGCDDIFGADLVHPRLTTVSAPLDLAGYHAADLLLAELDAGEARTGVALPTTLVVRESTAAPGAGRSTTADGHPS